jgi:hypothetical protein
LQQRVKYAKNENFSVKVRWIPTHQTEDMKAKKFGKFDKLLLLKTCCRMLLNVSQFENYCQRDPRYIWMCPDAPPYRYKRVSPIKDHLRSNWIANCINGTQDRPYSAMIWMAREGNKLLLLRKHHNPTELSYDSVVTQPVTQIWLDLREKCRHCIPRVQAGEKYEDFSGNKRLLKANW